MSLESVPIKNIMIADVKTTTHNETLQQACKVMADNKIGSVIVIGSEGENPKVPVGIITDTDVVRQIAADASAVNSKVQQLMSRPLITIASSASMKDSLMMLISNNIRRLAVVDNGVLVGIITDRDIYRVIGKDESLLTGLVSDELLVQHVRELEQPWVYNLGEILHKRG